MTNYNPIPIYDDIYWDLTTESCHTLLIAPSGAGKTMFLSYLAGMVLKRGHNLFIIDAKNTSFGATFQSSGVHTASTPDEILCLLTDLVESMTHDYDTIFSSDNVQLDDNFATYQLPAQVLIFDEVLSALDSGDKKQKVEMERLLKLLALKGRMAGYIIVLTSQRLLATDLPKAVTEQCQTRYVMGANISEELFHLATGSYKKNLGTSYKGDIGKGYVVTPKNGLTYFESPVMNFKVNDFRALIHDLCYRRTT
ncbi:AAA family ATPase [Listeria monocytogenes]|nr:AAA family ATPase [Listeria monocytogenes]EAE2195919.1 AAA family ATPase [Listeria monocytogenes]EAE2217978.1 AAA family ATPase [Listeria monocytogenes]EAE2226990.1 AAA family ATPase [Listeria monocytogenes]